MALNSAENQIINM